MRVTFPDSKRLPGPVPAIFLLHLIPKVLRGARSAGHAPLLPSLLLLAPIKVP